MANNVVPMIHVPDVRKAVEWYTDIGFTVYGTHGEGDELDWAMLGYGSGRFMFNEGGRASDAERREVDLYVDVDDVDALYAKLRGRVEIVQEPYDAFHGNRELIVRDLNRFWITFAHPIGT